MQFCFRFGALALWSATIIAAGCAAAAPAPMYVPDEPATGATPVIAGGGVGFPQYPTLSPDGQVVVFAWGGDLWASPIEGGVATRLTVHPADERRSAFSPDGTMLAFESDRDGARNLYVMPISRSAGGGVVGGTSRRVTASDRGQTLSGFTPDGKALLFTAFLDPTIYKKPQMYRVELDGTTGEEVAGAGGVSGGRVSRVTDGLGSMARMTADGSTAVFHRGYGGFDRPAYRGSGSFDVWKMNVGDGVFTRLTFDAANDFDGWPLPDGSIVFVSSRDGQNNVYRMPMAGESGGAPVPLTSFQPTAEQKSIGHGVRDLAVSADGKVAVFAVWDRLYRLDLSDPAAKPIAIGVIGAGDEVTLDIQRINVDKELSEAALSPDGKTLAVVARGEVFVRAMTEGFPTRRVTTSAGRERDLAWSPDGRVLYFVSDDPRLTVAGAGDATGQGQARGTDALGTYVIYGATVSLAREDITPEKPKPKEDTEKKEEKKDDGEKKEDTKTDKPADTKPDDAGKDGAKPAAKPKDKKPDFGKRWAESLRFAIEPVVMRDDDARSPVPSPDGRMLLYTYRVGDVFLLNLETGESRELFKGWEESEIIWAPDARHIIYATQDLDFNSDVWLMDTGGAEQTSGASKPPINLTRHPDLDGSPRLSADGKVLTFLSERGGQDDQFDVYQVYLDKELEGMTSYEREEYFKKAAEAAAKRKPIETPAFALKRDKTVKEAPKEEPKADGEKKDEASKPEAKKPKPEPLTFDAADAYMRIRRITSTPQSERNLEVTPGADRIVFSGPTDTDTSLQSIDFKGGDKKVLQAGAVSNVTMSLTGDRVVFLRTGLAFSTPPKGGKVDAWPIDAPVIVDIPAQQRQKFLELSRTFGDRFYHPTMKGLDWPALTRRYLALAERTRTSAEFNRVAELLFGEVNGSHTGAMGGPGYTAPSPGTGYMGVRVKPVAGGYEVTHVAPESPASLKNARLNVGDVLVSVEGRRFATDDASLPAIDLDAAMAGRAGRETLIEVRRAAGSPAPKPDPEAAQTTQEGASKSEDTKRALKPFVVIIPLSAQAWTALRYQEEVAQRRAMVDELSGGKLGYLHIRAMGESEVREFERDLFAAASGKDGLIIDVRDNGGGSTADILLASLTAPRHAWTVPRGADPKTVPPDAYPRDRRLIYGYTRPITVLINEHSFSNAEIFAHAIKTTGRGRLVGTPTFGGVISTGAFSLIDGTVIRMPFRGWYLPDGTDMENHGAEPDVLVVQTPTDEAAGKDPQLEAAVKDMLANTKK